MPSHTALIGDIKGSRKLDNWPEVFRKLQEILEEANHHFTDDILIPFKPTVGDEFQGALKTPDKAYDVYTFIKASLPVPACFGMGIGEVEKSGEEEKGLRGTAFYRARDALERCKREKGILRIKSLADTKKTDRTMNVVLRLIENIENSWTERQREVVSYQRLYPELTLQQIGDHFNVTHSTISQVLKAAELELIKEGESLFGDLLLFSSSESDVSKNN